MTDINTAVAWAQATLLNAAVSNAVEAGFATLTAPVVAAGVLTKAGVTYLIVFALQITLSGTWYLGKCAVSGTYGLLFKPSPKKSEEFDDCGQEIKVIEMATQTPGA